MKRTATLIVCALVGVSSAARAEVLWRGDYSTGDTSQWTKAEVVSADRLQVMPDPLGGERQVLQATVRKGDDPIDASGNRNEVIYRGDRPREGEDRWYRWQTLFPEGFQPADWYQIFTQWHQYVAGGSPPLAFLVWGNEIRLGSGARYYWTVPLETGKWHDFLVHVRWSSDETVGGVEIWYDGELSLPFTSGATLFPNDTVYLKQGLYRKEIIEQEQVVFHTGMTIGTTREDVAPAAPAPTQPDAPIASADPALTAVPEDNPDLQPTANGHAIVADEETVVAGAAVAPGTSVVTTTADGRTVRSIDGGATGVETQGLELEPGTSVVATQGCSSAGWSPLGALPFALPVLGMHFVGRRRRRR